MTALEKMTFGQAIELLKSGKKVARFGWNGKGMYIFLKKGKFNGIWYGFEKGVNPSENHPSTMDGVSFGLFENDENTNHAILPCFCMSSATGSIVVGWLASQTDMLSQDWVEIKLGSSGQIL